MPKIWKTRIQSHLWIIKFARNWTNTSSSMNARSSEKKNASWEGIIFIIKNISSVRIMHARPRKTHLADGVSLLLLQICRLCESKMYLLYVDAWQKGGQTGWRIKFMPRTQNLSEPVGSLVSYRRCVCKCNGGSSWASWLCPARGCTYKTWRVFVKFADHSKTHEPVNTYISYFSKTSIGVIICFKL
jgi:hypothetical protein